mmetsp:Transcript_120935/g.324620  ORF Transcript_120935/g.324620 Transcript_120935/m.324620 type:complete len:210 (-) Transcript_120935:501-1130(-)
MRAAAAAAETRRGPRRHQTGGGGAAGRWRGPRARPTASHPTFGGQPGEVEAGAALRSAVRRRHDRPCVGQPHRLYAVLCFALGLPGQHAALAERHVRVAVDLALLPEHVLVRDLVGGQVGPGLHVPDEHRPAGGDLLALRLGAEVGIWVVDLPLGVPRRLRYHQDLLVPGELGGRHWGHHLALQVGRGSDLCERMQLQSDGLPVEDHAV